MTTVSTYDSFKTLTELKAAFIATSAVLGTYICRCMGVGVAENRYGNRE